jgi:hypothetical protein
MNSLLTLKLTSLLSYLVQLSLHILINNPLLVLQLSLINSKPIFMLFSMENSRPYQLIVAKESSALHTIQPLVDNTLHIKSILDPGCQIIAMSEDVYHGGVPTTHIIMLKQLPAQ